MIASRLRLPSLLALLAGAAVLLAQPGTASAHDDPCVVRPGVYDGKWHGDKVKFLVEKVSRDGCFSGIVHFDAASNWPDARFDFVGQVGPRESIIVRRIKDNCAQVGRSSGPCREGGTLVWRGTVSEGNLDRPYPFELRIPLGR
jgi:hypothetical protein